MAFEATKREWSELYVFFRLLADGKVSLGTPQAKKEDEKYRPIAMIQREEHDGTRRYYIEEEVIRMEGEKVEKSIPREDFATVAAESVGRYLCDYNVYQARVKAKASL